jgi:MFS family permease
VACLAATPAERPHRPDRAASRLGDFDRGWRAQRRDPLLRSTLIGNAVVSGVWTTVFFFVLPLAISQLQLGEPAGGGIGTYGLVLASYGLVNLASNIVVGSLGHPRKPAAMAFLGFVLSGSGILVIAWACTAELPPAWRMPALMLATGFSAIGGPLKDITVATWRQMHIPSRDMAAAVRLQLLLGYLCTLIAMLVAPLLSQKLGAIPVMICGGAIYLVVAALGWAKPEIRAIRA